MWQTCPICKGSGCMGYHGIKCDTCNGTKIISELTGKPPVETSGYMTEKPLTLDEIQ